MSITPKKDFPKALSQENPHKESPISRVSKTPSEAVLAWRKMMDESTLSTQEKIKATKVLMKLRQVQAKNRVLFDKLGLGHDGHPKRKLT